MGPVDKLSSANDSAESTGYFARGGQIFVSFKDLSWKKPQPTIAAQPKPPIRGGESWLRPTGTLSTISRFWHCAAAPRQEGRGYTPLAIQQLPGNQKKQTTSLPGWPAENGEKEGTR